MKNIFLILKLSFFSLIFYTSVNGQNLSITFNQTAQQLVLNMVGPGISTTNISGQLIPASNGIFVNNGVNGLNLTSGIILSTGQAAAISNFPASNSVSTNNGMSGDSDLDAIVFPQVTEDASVVEFDFTAANDSVEFLFVFGSEEYNEYVNSNFNDVFAFVINGPGYLPNTNVALLPGTATPITINTVNNGPTVGTATATGPCMNCNFYIDNVGTTAVDMALDGLIMGIKIKFPIWPCTLYHFKLGIADVADGIFDSAVMIEENSFIPCPNMQGFRNGSAVNDTLLLCAGGTLELTAPSGPSYSWNTGETTQSITVSQAGDYSFIITDPQISCFAISDVMHVSMQGVIQTPVISQNTNTLVTTNIIQTPGITFQWSLNGTPISGATQLTLSIPGNGCYTLTIYEGTCESTSNSICITNTAIHEIAENNLLIAPHPVTGVSTIETPFYAHSISTLQLKDLQGRIVRSPYKQSGKSLSIERGNLSEGIYILEISNNYYQGTLVKKVIIN